MEKEYEPEPPRPAAPFVDWVPARKEFLTQRLIQLEANGAASMADLMQISLDVDRPLDEVIYVTWHLQRMARVYAIGGNGGLVGGWAVQPMPPRC